MENEKKDLRVIRTKTLIENATLELIELKGFSNVHLVDIAERAMVNRNTIYLHYSSKEDIVYSLLSKTFAEQFDEMDVENLIMKRLSHRNFEKMFVKLLNIINSQIELYRILITDVNLSGYVYKFLKIVKDKLSSSVKESTKNKIGIEYIVEGVYGVIKKWIATGLGSIEDNAKALSDLTIANVRKLIL